MEWKLADSKKTEKFCINLRYFINAKLNKQNSQAMTHYELVAQTQCIENNETKTQYTNYQENLPCNQCI